MRIDLKEITLNKEKYIGRLSIDSLCVSTIYYDMSWVKADTVRFEPSKYKVEKTTSGMPGGAVTKYWAIKYDNILEIKIPEVEKDAERKIKALEKWMFGGKNNTDEGILLDEEGAWWVSQCNSVFSGETCWDDECKNNKCCNKAANKILANAGTSTNNAQKIVISESSNTDCSGLTGKSDKFKEAIRIIDKSLKEHGLPIMVGVQHPYAKNNWKPKCSGNDPNITNHYVIIRGKKYDSIKKQYYYLFFEVGTSNITNGQSLENKLYINRSESLIKGNTKFVDYNNYYTVTEVRKNIGQTY